MNGQPHPHRALHHPLSWTAGYDSRNRLTQLNRAGAETTYTYDANSNRLSAVDKVTSDTDLNGDFTDADFSQSTEQALIIAPDSNRLLGFAQTLTKVRGTKTLSTLNTNVAYTLDANGALTSDGLRDFEYDEANRLSKVKVFKDGEAAKVRYLHNALGQRVFKGEPEAEQTLPNESTLGQGFIDWLKSNFKWLFASAQANTSIGTGYSYADSPLPTWALLGEYDNGSAAGKGRTEYIWLPTEDPSTGSGQASAIPVGIFRNGKFFAIHTDHLGTPRLMTNEANQPVWQWPYSAFGNNKPTGVLKATPNPKAALTNQPTLLKATNATELNLRFPGQYADDETGLFYNYYRNYLASQGRYTQNDPIGLQGGLSRYTYVYNAPLMFTDPMGLLRNPSDIYDDALRDARRSGLPGAHNGIQDAYRHCLASCEMARENGQAAAQCLGWANEKRGDWWRNQETGERQMDDFNNAAGFQFGRTAQSYQACQNSCMNAATSGGLRTYTPGTTPGYWY